MIRINLQLFGGGGSGDDGIGAAKNNGDAFKAIREQQFSGSAGRSGIGQSAGGSGNREPGDRTTSSGRITYSKEIEKRIQIGETYSVVRYNYSTDKSTKYDSMEGEDLRNILRGFEFDDDKNEWYSEKNDTVYRIEKKKKKK